MQTRLGVGRVAAEIALATTICRPHGARSRVLLDEQQRRSRATRCPSSGSPPAWSPRHARPETVPDAVPPRSFAAEAGFRALLERSASGRRSPCGTPSSRPSSRSDPAAWRSGGRGRPPAERPRLPPRTPSSGQAEAELAAATGRPRRRRCRPRSTPPSRAASPRCSPVSRGSRWPRAWRSTAPPWRRGGGASGVAGSDDPGRCHRRAHRPRAAGARAHRPGPQQPPDRRAAVHQRQDRERARLGHPEKARCILPHRGGIPWRARYGERGPHAAGAPASEGHIQHDARRHPAPDHGGRGHVARRLRGPGEAHRERRLPVRPRAAVREARAAAADLRRPRLHGARLPEQPVPAGARSTTDAIAEYCSTTWGVTFPIFDRVQGQRALGAPALRRAEEDAGCRRARPAGSRGTSRSSSSRPTARCTASVRTSCPTTPRDRRDRGGAAGCGGAASASDASEAPAASDGSASWSQERAAS